MNNKIILDLCGGTGSWSKPYKNAGYEVVNITLPEYDILWTGIFKGELRFGTDKGLEKLVIQTKDVYGILAAPPCTMFSLARTTAKEPRNLDKAMEVVHGCLRVIWECEKYGLKFWAMENPKGLLRKFMGKPAFEFDASEFGEGYNKHTDLWGYFNPPSKIKAYTRFLSTDKNTRVLPPIPEGYLRDPNMRQDAIRRSITPDSFANAFSKANK